MSGTVDRARIDLPGRHPHHVADAEEVNAASIPEDASRPDPAPQ
jgi:hypothetical protein